MKKTKKCPLKASLEEFERGLMAAQHWGWCHVCLKLSACQISEVSIPKRTSLGSVPW